MTVFADSFYFLALVNPRDPAHARATAWAATMPRARLLTTNLVLTEVADAFCKARMRGIAAALLRDLLGSPRVSVVTVDDILFADGLDLYESRPDKDWSLTDCVSFVVMEREGVAESLTGDRHFVQAGFRVLLD